MKISLKKTTISGYPTVETHNFTVISFDLMHYRRVTDGWTDGRTDRRTDMPPVAKSRYSIAECDNNRPRTNSK